MPALLFVCSLFLTNVLDRMTKILIYHKERDTIAVGACQKLIQSGTSKNAYDMCIYIYITTSFCEIIEVRDQETYDLNGIPERSYAADVFFHSLPP